MKGTMKFTALSFSAPFPALPLHPSLSVATSLWPAGSWCGCSLWPFPQFLCQCRAVDLQCSRSSTHTDPLETPFGGQQRLVLHQPVPRLCSYQQGSPGSGPLLQLENSDGGVRRQHRYGTLMTPHLTVSGLNKGNPSVLEALTPQVECMKMLFYMKLREYSNLRIPRVAMSDSFGSFLMILPSSYLGGLFCVFVFILVFYFEVLIILHMSWDERWLIEFYYFIFYDYIFIYSYFLFMLSYPAYSTLLVFWCSAQHISPYWYCNPIRIFKTWFHFSNSIETGTMTPFLK